MITDPIQPPVTDVPPIARPVDDTERPVIYEGQTMTLPSEGLGSTAGRVSIRLGPIAAAANVISWGPEAVIFTTPRLGLTESAPAMLVISTTDGTTLGQLAIRFAPPAEPTLPQVPVGSRLTLSGNNFGSEQGQVRVQVGPVQMQATVINWTSTTAEVELPSLSLAESAAAELIVLDRQGNVAERKEVQLVAAR